MTLEIRLHRFRLHCFRLRPSWLCSFRLRPAWPCRLRLRQAQSKPIGSSWTESGAVDSENRFILGPLCSNVPIISVLLFQIVGIVEFKRPNCRRTSHLYLPFSIFRVALTSLSTPRTFLLFVTVAMLSFYRSPVNSTIRNADGNFTHKENCRYYCHFPGLEFM